jgi:hypothetical protein
MNELTAMTNYEMEYKLKNYIHYKTSIYICSFMIDIQIFMENKKISITIPKNIQWEEIIRRIDSQLQSELINECLICDNPENNIHFVSCNKCAKHWCNSCYIGMVKNNIDNETILTCPFCRFLYQGEIPTFIITQK